MQRGRFKAPAGASAAELSKVATLLGRRTGGKLSCKLRKAIWSLPQHFDRVHRLCACISHSGSVFGRRRKKNVARFDQIGTAETSNMRFIVTPAGGLISLWDIDLTLNYGTDTGLIRTVDTLAGQPQGAHSAEGEARAPDSA